MEKEPLNFFGFFIILFSLFACVVFLASSSVGLDIIEILHGFPTIIIPQALFDGLVAIGIHWAITRWTPETSNL